MLAPQFDRLDRVADAQGGHDIWRRLHGVPGVNGRDPVEANVELIDESAQTLDFRREVGDLVRITGHTVSMTKAPARHSRTGAYLSRRCGYFFLKTSPSMAS